ncbi:unnamed protein product [Gulo gulo]|uniref:Uncharacterized protein n=1 Tax=Gulo gulo TaxID=48420 RepID=A0A9X9M5Y7_GULGU|nr:unnamed protein product [Gulo gulo]
MMKCKPTVEIVKMSKLQENSNVKSPYRTINIFLVFLPSQKSPLCKIFSIYITSCYFVNIISNGHNVHGMKN